MLSRSILAIDLGASRIKFGVLNESGVFAEIHALPAPVAHPEPGATVQDPRQIVQACLEGLKRCAAVAIKPQAVVLTGQMGGVMVVDRQGGALTPWITNMDSRGQGEAAALQREVGARVRRLTASAPEQAPCLRWIRQAGTLREEPALALLLAPYLATQLAAGGLDAAFCDRTCIGWSGLADVASLSWDDELARAALWPVDRLPPIVEPGALVGHLAGAIAAATGLPAGLPIMAGPGDQAASLYALGASTPGDLADSASTFPLLIGVTDHFFVPRNDRLEVMPGAVPGTWHPLGSMLGTGGMPAWYAGMLAGATLAELEREAEAAGGSAGILALPYGVLGAGRAGHGVFWGLDPSHHRGHLYRAILEGIACEYALLAEQLAAEGVEMRAPVRAYGGGNASALLRRLKAGVLAMPMHYLSAGEMTLAGAALLAARSLGWTVDLAAGENELVCPGDADIEAFRATLDTYRRLRHGVSQMLEEGSFMPSPR
jgi:xylulokinase